MKTQAQTGKAENAKLEENDLRSDRWLHVSDHAASETSRDMGAPAVLTSGFGDRELEYHSLAVNMKEFPSHRPFWGICTSLGSPLLRAVG